MTPGINLCRVIWMEYSAFGSLSIPTISDWYWNDHLKRSGRYVTQEKLVKNSIESSIKTGTNEFGEVSKRDYPARCTPTLHHTMAYMMERNPVEVILYGYYG